MAIRYNKALENEITRVVRNFNQKVRRLEKSEKDLILPERVSAKEIKRNVQNRNELKRKLKDLELYSKRGIEATITTKGGVEISKYEYSLFKKEVTRAKRNLTRRINELSSITPTVYGIKQDVTYAQMGTQQLINLKARRKKLSTNFSNLSKGDLSNFMKYVKNIFKRKEYVDENFKMNYIDKLNNLAYYINYDDEKLDEMKDKLLSLPTDKFLDLFDREQSIRDLFERTTSPIGYISNEDVADYTELYNNLYENLDTILKDYK